MDEANPNKNVSNKSQAFGWIVTVACLSLVICVPNLLLWRKLEVLQQNSTKERWFWKLCQPGYSDEDRREAFADLLWVGNTEWKSARLQRLDFTGIELPNTDIQYASLDGCKLIRADLTGAVFRGTRLPYSDLTDAILMGADLFEVDLFKSELSRAVFDFADMRGATLEQSNAVESSFVKTDLSGARLELIKLQGANLSSANLTDADLRLANVSSSNLSGTDLSDANLSQVMFQNSNWWRAKGLSREQIATMFEQYSPDEKASANLRRDYDAWLAEDQNQWLRDRVTDGIEER